MKVRIKTDGQLVIESESTYEALALDSWHDKFFKNLNTKNLQSELIGKPLLNITLSYDEEMR